MCPHTWLHPSKPPKGTYATKQISGPKGQQARNPHTENKQEHGKEPRSKQTSMDLRQKAWTRANKGQTCTKELIQTFYRKLGVWMYAQTTRSRSTPYTKAKNKKKAKARDMEL